MTEKIKLVYSWVGPHGPIWNTELPNVLNFASVAQGVGNMNSLKFFGDDLARFFDCHNPNSDYEIFPTVSIHSEDYRPFILPFTLSWRIPFDRYFTGREGILEYSHVNDHVINFVRHRNGYILINHSIEAFMESHYIDVLHSYFGNVHYIPLHKIIYLTGCINAKEIYEDYCNQRGIPDEPHRRLTIVTYPTSFTSFVPNTREGEVPPYDTETVPPKLFLSWNRRLRGHRIELAVNLERYNLVERSLISFSNEDQDYPGRSILHHFDYPRFNAAFNISDEVTNRFIERLPLVLDDEHDITRMCQDYDNVTRSYYQQTLVSLVTETNFYDKEVSLTEKSFKPTKEKHPFIIAGVNGVLKGMHELGFKTFSDFWDESYDDIADPTARMQKIMDIVGYIGSWTDEQILDFKRKVKPILDHNYQVISTASSKVSVDKITNLIKGNL